MSMRRKPKIIKTKNLDDPLISYRMIGVSLPFYDIHWGPFDSVGEAKLMLYRLLKCHDRGYDAYS